MLRHDYMTRPAPHSRPSPLLLSPPIHPVHWLTRPPALYTLDTLDLADNTLDLGQHLVPLAFRVRQPGDGSARAERQFC